MIPRLTPRFFGFQVFSFQATDSKILGEVWDPWIREWKDWWIDSNEVEDDSKCCKWRGFAVHFFSMAHGVTWCLVVLWSHGHEERFLRCLNTGSQGALWVRLCQHTFWNSPVLIWYMPHTKELFCGTCPWSIGLAKMKRARLTFHHFQLQYGFSCLFLRV